MYTEVRKRSLIQRLRFLCRQSAVDLESAAGAGWVLAWAVAVTLDLDVGQLGDADH